jgi:hypothetical protein
VLLWQLNLEATDRLRVYSVSATAGTTPERLRVYSVSATAGVATDRIRVYSVSAEAGAASGTTINAGPGNAGAVGVTALAGSASSINATPAEAGAAGVTAQLHRIFGAQVGQAIASGVKANILINGVLPRNAQGLRKTRYTPGRVPYELAQLSQFLQSEIERITDGLESPFTHQLLEPLAVEPARRSTTQAMVVYADGTNWDPGSGEGIYAYYSGTWTKLG